MVETLKSILTTANAEDKNTAEFSDTDLKEFTDLVDDAESYKALTDGLKDLTTINEVKKIT